MTEPLKVITCLDPTGEREECGALVENTSQARQIHRAHHAQDKKVKDAFRSAISSRDEKIRQLELKLADILREVANIEIPEPPASIEISEDGWSDDDEPDDDTGEPVNTPDNPGATERAERNDLDAYRTEAYPAIDRDDDLDTRLANATGNIDLLG